MGTASGAHGQVLSSWWDYHIIMWQAETPRQLAALRTLGITAGEVHLPDRDEPDQLSHNEIDPLVAANLMFYVENIATDFYSAYHRWFPNRPVNWLFQAAKARYQAHPNDLIALWRDPSLSDPRWLRAIHDRLVRAVRAHAPYRPLFYNLADEAGIAELSIFWDFDLSDPSLRAMRVWLRERYGTLTALNAEWGSNFAEWSAVMPMTTREVMRRTDDNYSAWSDFKAWMDVAFARALRHGTDAVHKADPRALAGLEGAQIPGWGGYDYSHLASAVDVMEVYDGGGNLEIVRSLNPQMILLTTSASGGSRERYQAWRELLRGSRGLILWDPHNEFAQEDGTLGPRGRDAAQMFHELRSGIGALLINSERQFEPVAILYSPSSMRVQWLLDWTPRGDAWLNRKIADSYEDENPVRTAMMAYARRLEQIGAHPRFLTRDLVEDGELLRDNCRILIMPHVISLSAAEGGAIRDFVKQGGAIIADLEPGAFDEHGRRLEKAPLSDLFADAIAADRPAKSLAAKGLVYLIPAEGSTCSAGPRSCGNTEPTIEGLMASRLAPPPFTVSDSSGERPGDVETYRFRNGEVELVALQHETSSPGDSASSESLWIAMSHPAYLYNLRQHRALGLRDSIELTLDPIEPAILAASSTPLPAPMIEGPTELYRGEAATFQVRYGGRQPAAIPILRADILDPSGQITQYSRNLPVVARIATFGLRLQPHDPLGTWRIHVTDVLSGQIAEVAFEVRAPGHKR